MEASRQLVHVEAPETETVLQVTQPLIAAANAVVVIDRASHASALVQYQELKRMIKRVEEHFEPTRAALDKAKKELLKARDTIIAPIDAACRVLNGKVSDYEIAEQRRMAEERRRAEEEQNKKLLEERLARAAEAEKAGNVDKADAILEAPVPPPTVVEPLAQTAEIKGVSKPREIWRAEIVDGDAFLAWAVEHKRLDLLEIDQSAINGEARKYRDALDIPGLKPTVVYIRAVWG